MPKAKIIGVIDRVESRQPNSRIHGWCFDVERRSAPDELRVKKNSKVIGKTRTFVHRADLAGLGLPDTVCGFSIDLKGAVGALSELILVDGSGEQVEIIVAPDHKGNNQVIAGGHIDVVTAHGLSGWAIVTGGSTAAVYIDVEIDGHPFARLPADEPRPDLKAMGISSGGGFAVNWGPSPTGKPQFEVSVRHSATGTDLRGSPATVVDAAVEGPGVQPVDLSECAVTIIVPIYNAPEMLERCLTALVRNTTLPADLLLVDDASPDPRVSKVLSRYRGRERVKIVRHPSNLGFARTVDQAIRQSSDDVILLNSDTEVGPRWLENILVASRQGEKTGTVTALSDNAGAFSAPDANRANLAPSTLSPDETARLVTQVAAPIYPRVGTGNGFCMFIRRACFEEIGGFDVETFGEGYGEEGDFCVRASRAGWQHILDDRTYVLHRREASFGERAAELKKSARKLLGRYPEYDSIVESFGRRGDLSAVRYRIRRAFAEPPARIRPRILFVISTKTGGTPQTNRDLMRELSDRFEPCLLISDGQMLELIEPRDSGDRLLARHVLGSPIGPVLHTSDEYSRVVGGWLLRYAIELVHIRHLAWHSLDLPLDCKKLGIPSVLSFHDYYLACPSVKLLDENLLSCSGTCTPSKGSCGIELWSPHAMPPLKHQYVHVWRKRSAAALSHCDAFVTTSEAAKSILLSAFPDCAGNISVISHGRTFQKVGQAAAVPKEPELFRVLLAGNLSRAKGSALVSTAAKLLRGEGVEFHLLGTADDGLNSDDVVMHGPYEREEFVDAVLGIKPAMGLLPSLWPETYCHVLTEMWAAGVPVLGFDCGAVAERIRDHGGGWLFDEPTVEVVVDAIRNIRKSRRDLIARTKEVAEWQAGPGQAWTVTEMTDEYIKLYMRMLQSRRSLAGVGHHEVQECQP